MMQAKRGFTLMELLIALVVMSLLAAAVVININQGGASRQLQTEAERLREILQIALDESALRSRDLGLYVQENGYSFMERVLDNKTKKIIWQPLIDEPVLRAREVAGMELSIKVEDEDLPLFSDQDEDSAREERKESKRKPIPQVYLLSSGELVPFVLTLTAEPYRFELKGEADGRVLLSGVLDSRDRAEFVDPDAIEPVKR